MDGPTVDHSDSDSGESWTVLDHSPAYADDAPELAENNSPLKRETPQENAEKDEDTDGISVISDSEPESSTPCEISYDNCRIVENRPMEQLNPQIISVDPLPTNNNSQHDSMQSENDFLGDNTVKHKTYVHRRNKRLSTVLNIIMLGSVITAAGVAIGHMWGARYDCTMQTTPSVNKILSNLYKLQEENAYLRNKLKELTLAGSIQFQQRKVNTERIPFKQRCKKVFEEPLTNKNADKVTKCIDDTVIANKNFENHMTQPQYENEFVNDIEKLKTIYQQNKSWLDEEISKRMKNEEHAIKKMTIIMKDRSPLTSITEEQKGPQDDNIIKENVNSDKFENISDVLKAIFLENKITYAESLKSERKPHKIEKRESNVVNDNYYRAHIAKRKPNKENVVMSAVLSDEELKKDDRYVGPKTKLEKKKRDRQKLHKKQKRKNKYEQWELKGGYMKDYDESSISSSQDMENIWKKTDKNHLNHNSEKNDYINQFSVTDNSHSPKPKNEIENSKSEKHAIKPDKVCAKKNKDEDPNWFDKRAVLRTEARKRLEHELFGETSPNNAGWYFRRMQRREQCRAKADNSTYKKLLKRNMNFKMKH